MGFIERLTGRKRVELLIVVDDNDAVKKSMRAMKEFLEAKNLCRIQHMCIYDEVSDENIRLFNKVIILRAGSEITEHEQRWIAMFHRATDKGIQHMVLRLCDSVERASDGTDEPTSTSGLVYLKSDVLSWFAKVLEFLFARRNSTNSDKVECGLIICPTEATNHAPFQEKTVQFLETLGITDADAKENANVTVVLCDSLDVSLEQSIKTTLRQKKQSGAHVFVFSSSNVATKSEDIEWIATQTYTRQDAFLFVLHLYKKLGLIDIRDDQVRLSKIPERVQGKLLFRKQRISTGEVTLEWQLHLTVGEHPREYLHLQRRTEGSREWETLAENLPPDTASYEVTGLETNFRYQFRLLRETAAGQSEPLTSKWLSWKKYSGPMVLLKVFYYTLAALCLVLTIPQVFIVLVAFILSELIIKRPHNTLESTAMWAFYTIVCLVALIALFVFYALTLYFWLLFISVYVIVWCLIIHFLILKFTADAIVGSIYAPLMFYLRASDVIIQFNIYDDMEDDMETV